MNQMSYQKTGFSRRGFMIGIAGLTFAVAVGHERFGHAATEAPDVSGTAFSPWVSIAPSGEISIMAPATEMGNGSLTSLPLILAEELDADWSKVVAVPAPPIDKIYGNPAPAVYGFMLTAHSLSVQGYFTMLRTFGAQVRAMLLDNVARHWRVPLAELSTEPSVVVHAKSGRRISYGEIVTFAEIPAAAPDIKPEALKKPSDFRLIGHDVMRVELPTKVNGSAKYAIDVQTPGMIYGAIVRSPVLGGAPDKVDDAAAKAVAGVIDVVRLPYGVGVLAKTPWAAFVAKSALEPGVTWLRKGKAWGFDSDKGLDAFAADARDLKKPTVEWYKQGDAEAALATAATRIEAQYRNHYTYHAQMEPLNATASVSATGDAAEVWCGTQFPTAAQAAAARALDIPAEKVKLNYTLLGGGFGRRGDYAQEFVVDAVLMSKSARRPVKVMWTREDDVHYGHFRPITAHYLRGGLDASGKLIAYHQRLVGDRVLQAENPIFFRKAHGKDYQLMGGTELKSYDIPNQYAGQIPQDTGVRTAPLRGIGDIANKFVAEVFLDEVAHERGVDPLQFRLEMLKITPRGLKVLRRAAEMADWNRPRDNTALGCAFANYNETLLGGVAEVSVDRSTGWIRVHNFWATIDCGIPVQPDNIVAQMEGGIMFGFGLALTEEISIRDGAVEQSNFYDYRVMRMTDAPEIHVEVIATDNHPTGVGQMPVVLVTPALNNAVARLTGVRLREAPMTPERVKKALG
jgi:isoquinoline 1-oxidoreductase beta subunit